VINADADEAFVRHHGGLADVLRRVLNNVYALTASRTGFVPVERPEHRPPFIVMIYRKAVFLPCRQRVAAQGTASQSSRRRHPAAKPRRQQRFASGRADVERYRSISIPRAILPAVRAQGPQWRFELRAKSRTRVQGFHKRRWYDQPLRGELEREFGEKVFSDKHRLRCVLD
jgi:hypothetical protein